MGAALKFKHADVPRQASEKARLKVVHGPDLGAIFVIKGDRATIGRGEENDIFIADLKASRKHAEFFFSGERWNVRDSGSANGIFHNGKNTRVAAIQSGDTVTVGETTLEFVNAEAGTAMLMAVPKSLEQVQADQAAFSDQQKKVRKLAQFGGTIRPRAAGQPGQSPGAQAKKPRMILLVAAAGAAVYVFFGSSTPQPASHAPKREAAPSLATFLPQSDVTPNKSAEVFFKSGYREYLSQNYLRARTQFETVLQIDPGHALAMLYLEKCKKAIDDEVRFELDLGKKAYAAGSLKKSKLHYESVLRLLYRDQSSPSYVEAKEQLALVVKDMERDE